MDIEYIVLDKLDSGSNKGIIEFNDSVLNHDVDEKVWDWEFNTIDGTVFTLAKDGEVIAGTQSMLPVDICISGKTTKSAKSETSYLSPDYRGKKIFEKLYAIAVDETVKNGSQVIWGFTPAVKAWKKNLGFYVYEKSMSEVSLHKSSYKLFKTLKSSRNLLYGMGKFLIYNASFVKTYFRKISVLKNPCIFEIKHTLNSETDINKLFQKMMTANPNLIYIEMNKDYINWRVRNNPAIKYNQLFFYKNDELAGYVIYSMDSGKLNIADICYGTDKDTLKYMLRYMFKGHSDCTILTYWGNSECFVSKEVFSLLEDIGGKTTRDADRNFVFQKYNPDISLDQLEDLKNWHINGLWTEGFHI